MQRLLMIAKYHIDKKLFVLMALFGIYGPLMSYAYSLYKLKSIKIILIKAAFLFDKNKTLFSANGSTQY